MGHDLEAIVRQAEAIDEQFEALKDCVHSPEARSATAAAVELQLFRRLLALGAKLLSLYFIMRAAEPEAAPQGADGLALQPHSWQRRRYLSVFGLVMVRRRQGGGGGRQADRRRQGVDRPGATGGRRHHRRAGGLLAG